MDWEKEALRQGDLAEEWAGKYRALEVERDRLLEEKEHLLSVVKVLRERNEDAT